MKNLIGTMIVSLSVAVASMSGEPPLEKSLYHCDFRNPAGFETLPGVKGASGAIPKGWSENTKWDGAIREYSFEKDGGSGFFRIDLKKGEFTLQSKWRLAPSKERRYVRLSYKARSPGQAVVAFGFKKVAGSWDCAGSWIAKLPAEWAEESHVVLLGPANCECVLSVSGRGCIPVDIAWIGIEPCGPEGYVPQTTIPAESPVSKEWTEIHKRLAKVAIEAKPDVLFMGDSITQGWTSAPAWKERMLTLKAANFGIGGDKVQNLLWRVRNCEFGRISPKVAGVLIGVNNAMTNPPEEILQGKKALLAEIRKASPSTRILLLGVLPFGWRPDDGSRAIVKEINKLYLSLADGREVRYIDIGGVFLEADGSISKETMPDSLHLSPSAYGKFADAIIPEIDRMLKGE